MSPEANKAAVRQHIAAIAEGNVAVLRDHPAFRRTQPFCHRTLAAFANGDATVHEIVAEDNWVVARVIQRGTHQGEWMGIAATGKRVAWEIIVMFQLVDGVIVRVHCQADVLDLLYQLTAPPGPCLC